MSIYEEFINFLQKEYKFPKAKQNLQSPDVPKKTMKEIESRLKAQKIPHMGGSSTSPYEPKKIPFDVVTNPKRPSPKSNADKSWGEIQAPFKKGGVGSGRKAGSGSKLAAPKRGSPIKVAISRYQKKPSPSLHQKVVEAFRGKERKKEKTPDYLKELKHPWD